MGRVTPSGQTTRDFLPATLAAAIWGGMYVVSRDFLLTYPSGPLLFTRFAMTSFCLLPWALRSMSGLRAKDLGLAFLTGGVALFGSLFLQFEGTAVSSAHLASVITLSAPLLTAVLSPFLAKEGVSLKLMGALFLATAGAAVAGAGGGGATLQGTLLLLGAAVFWAVYTLLSARLARQTGALGATFVTSLAATLVALPFEMAQPFPLASLGVGGWAGLIYLGVISTAVALILWNESLRRLTAARVSLFLFAQPIVGTVLGVFFLGEHLTTDFLMGSVLIIGSLIWAVWGDGSKKARTASPTFR